MALIKGTNSYSTVEEADSYFEDRLDASAWVNADEDLKSQALVTATSILDNRNWIGRAISQDQLLAFPRSGNYFDPKTGYNINLSSEVPRRIIKACQELAYHLMNNDGLLDETDSIENITVSTINLTNIQKANLIPSAVKNLIRPLESNSNYAWWRYN
jgi:hypothetical protein